MAREEVLAETPTMHYGKLSIIGATTGTQLSLVQWPCRPLWRRDPFVAAGWIGW